MALVLLIGMVTSRPEGDMIIGLASLEIGVVAGLIRSGGFFTCAANGIVEPLAIQEATRAFRDAP